MLSQAKAMQQVMEAAERFVKTCAEATDVQWQHRPDEDPHSWSIAWVEKEACVVALRKLEYLVTLQDG